MKRTAAEERFVHMLMLNGGSYCPPADVEVTRAFRRLARRMENMGVIEIEPVDDGYRYSLRDAAP